jgi:hypothetical protein
VSSVLAAFPGTPEKRTSSGATLDYNEAGTLGFIVNVFKDHPGGSHAS